MFVGWWRGNLCEVHFIFWSEQSRREAEKTARWVHGEIRAFLQKLTVRPFLVLPLSSDKVLVKSLYLIEAVSCFVH